MQLLIIFAFICFAILLIKCMVYLILCKQVCFYYPGWGQYERTVLGSSSAPVSYIVPMLTLNVRVFVCMNVKRAARQELEWWPDPLVRGSGYRCISWMYSVLKSARYCLALLRWEIWRVVEVQPSATQGNFGRCKTCHWEVLRIVMLKI